MHLIARWFVSALAILLTAYLVEGIEITQIQLLNFGLLQGFWAALFVALVLGFLNAVVRPIFIFFTLPITIITLGGFILVINALMLILTDRLIDGFEIKGFLEAFLGAILISIFSWIGNRFIRSDS